VAERGGIGSPGIDEQRTLTLDHASRAKVVAADDALRMAIKAALDADEFGRARALLDVLDPPRAE
jgi:hypothetical protein